MGADGEASYQPALSALVRDPAHELLSAPHAGLSLYESGAIPGFWLTKEPTWSQIHSTLDL
jgi:hypothetical protein